MESAILVLIWVQDQSVATRFVLFLFKGWIEFEILRIPYLFFLILYLFTSFWLFVSLIQMWEIFLLTAGIELRLYIILFSLQLLHLVFTARFAIVTLLWS
jgi:hypothetical protein